MIDFEECWVILGHADDDKFSGYLHKLADGSPCHVEFDHEIIWHRHVNYNDVLGFLHSHPGFQAYRSDTDIATMEAWCSCLGKNLICAIHGINGLRAWQFRINDEPTERFEVKKVGNRLIGKKIVSELLECK